MNNVYLDCSGLHNLRLDSNLPNSIQIDGYEFIQHFNAAISNIPKKLFVELEYWYSKELRNIIIDINNISEITSAKRLVMNSGDYIEDAGGISNNSYLLTDESYKKLIDIMKSNNLIS